VGAVQASSVDAIFRARKKVLEGPAPDQLIWGVVYTFLPVMDGLQDQSPNDRVGWAVLGTLLNLSATQFVVYVWR